MISQARKELSNENISILIIFLCILGCGKKGSLEFPCNRIKKQL